MPESPLHAVSPEPVDPFDPATLRVSSLANIEVEKVLTAVPVRKPNRTEFFRIHPQWVLDTVVIEREDGLDREVYIVPDPAIQDVIAHELRVVRLFTAISKRGGTVFLWPVKLPREDNDAGRRWSETALDVAEQAKSLWVKIVGDRNLGGYTMFRAKGDLGEPQWPKKTHRDLLEIAFRGHVIDRVDHPVIRELNGEL